MRKNQKTLEGCLELLKKRAKAPPVHVRDILGVLEGKGRFVAVVLLSLPFCQPLQIPGFSTPFGLVIACIGVQVAFGREFWLPKRVLAKAIAPSILKKIADKSLWLVRGCRRWIRPRLRWTCRHRAMQVVNGAVIVILGMLLALPLPIPFSNLMAAWSLFLMGVGLLEEDGVFVVVSYAAFFLTLVLFGAIGLSVKSLF